MGVNLGNILVVARREFTVKARTRAFRLGTLLLVIGAVIIALAPIGIRWVDRQVTTKVAVAASAELSFDPVARVGAMLNAGSQPDDPAFEVTAVAPADARAAVERDDYAAALLVDRPAGGGDLSFVVVTKDVPGTRTPELVRQAAGALAIADRLDRLGIAPADQAALFSPPEVSIEQPTATDETKSGVERAAQGVLGYGLVIFLLLAVILYGQWVATSVAEEKASRIMEIVLTAATPFQLLGGKVLGVGSLGLVQFGVALVAALVGVALQGQVATLVFGDEAASISLPQGLTLDVLAVFAVLFVLGFLLYAVLYAAAGSTVSRMEDVNSVVAPMSIISAVGYIVAVYSSFGLLPASAAWVVVLSFVPFFSPYMILSRYVAGQASPTDVVIAAAILVVSIAICLWIASRIYEAGVLAYGQKASIRQLLRLAFSRH